MLYEDKGYLSQNLFESSIDILKNNLCFSRARPQTNFFVQALGAVTAYIFKPQKPHISFPEGFIG